jgi:hypothetical protein
MYYGDRGVTIWPPWVESFENFYRDVGPRPTSKHRLQRYPDREGNYVPENVRWYYGGEAIVEPSLPPSKFCASFVGSTFGKLTIIEAYTVRLSNGKTHARLHCRCECGKEIDIFRSSMKSRKQLSCGSRECEPDRFKKTTGSANYRFKGYENIRAATWSKYQRGAKSRGLDFDLSIKEAWELYENQGRKCALSGVPISFEGGKPSNTSASLDRIDSSKGYSLYNVQWVHKTVNLMKNVLSVEEFLKWCSLVSTYRTI